MPFIYFQNLKKLAMKEGATYTQLLPIIERYLIQQSSDSCAAIQSRVFTAPLYFNILGKDITTFATDLNHSIQVQFTNKNVEQQAGHFARDPINRRITNYYFIKEKQWHAFNCSKKILDRDNSRGETIDSKQQITPYHAYQPQFYFTKDFPDFCVEKSKAKTYFLPCNRINIFKWRFRIVNVNLSGWYAPVLEIIDFKLDRQSIREDFRSISCVIYEDSLRLLMEKLRLQDMRGKKISKLAHEEQEISMLYFLKDARPVVGRRVNIFKADKDQELLAFHKLPSLKYVLFGEAEGLLTLKERLSQPPMCENKIRLMSMESLQVLFNRREALKPEEKEPQLWSSSDEEEGEGEKNRQPTVPMIDESEESNDEEDPLRNLYLKEFRGLSMGN